MSWAVVYDDFPRIRAGLEPAAARVVAKVAQDLQGDMQVRAPYEFGVLKASIRAYRIGDLHWRIIVGAEYGIYQEWGTRYMRAQPFVRPAVAVARPEFLAAMRAIVGG